jgi:pimeloyl-ACP methyl ester carboxylesterase
MDTNNEITAPGLIRMMLESRVPIEFITSLIFSRHISAIKGEGPVLVFPGFGAGDVTTLYLRNFLDGLGYDTYPWALGINLGPKEGVLDACIARVKFIYAKTGKKVSLIGHSLGGIYAREVAKLCPNETRLVISLGTPFVGDLTKTNATRLYEIIAGDTDIVNQYKLS